MIIYTQEFSDWHPSCCLHRLTDWYDISLHLDCLVITNSVPCSDTIILFCLLLERFDLPRLCNWFKETAVLLSDWPSISETSLVKSSELSLLFCSLLFFLRSSGDLRGRWGADIPLAGRVFGSFTSLWSGGRRDFWTDPLLTDFYCPFFLLDLVVSFKRSYKKL